MDENYKIMEKIGYYNRMIREKGNKPGFPHDSVEMLINTLRTRLNFEGMITMEEYADRISKKVPQHETVSEYAKLK